MVRPGSTSTIVTSVAALELGFGRDAMDRVANRKTSRVTDVYDRHGYAEEDKRSWRPWRGWSFPSSRGPKPRTWSA